MSTFVRADELARRLLARAPNQVDQAIERAELVRLVRDRGDVVRALAAAGTIGRELDEAIAEHSAACFTLDAYDHQRGAKQ